MNTSSNQQPSSAETRSHLYGLFARAFSHPDEALLDMLLDGQFTEAVMDSATYLPYPSPFPNATFSLIDAGYTRADIDIFYTSAFEAGQTGISLRESAYSRKSEADILQSTFRFYEHFGLDFTAGELRELPDLLPVELEFMHYLVYLQSTSRVNETTRSLIQAQADFLQRHLNSWIPSLVKALRARADGRLYAALSLQLESLLIADLQFLESNQ